MFPKSAAANRGHNLSWKAGAVKISDAVLCLMTPAVNNAPSPSLLKSDRICFAIDFSANTSLVVYHHPENTLACFCSPLLAVTWQNITKGLGGGNGQKSLILPNLRLWFSHLCVLQPPSAPLLMWPKHRTQCSVLWPLLQGNRAWLAFVGTALWVLCQPVCSHRALSWALSFHFLHFPTCCRSGFCRASTFPLQNEMGGRRGVCDSKGTVLNYGFASFVWKPSLRFPTLFSVVKWESFNQKYGQRGPSIFLDLQEPSLYRDLQTDSCPLDDIITSKEERTADCGERETCWLQYHGIICAVVITGCYYQVLLDLLTFTWIGLPQCMWREASI